MDVANYKEFLAQRDLAACGLTEESINAIRSTSVVNHNGSQHIAPSSQASKFTQTENPKQDEDPTSTIPTTVLSTLQTQLQEQQKMFSRFKQYTDSRITSLERQLASAQETINNMSNRVNTLASNARASQPPSNNVQAVAQTQTTQKAPSEKPIDRNGVSPESVQIDKIFYYGNR